MKVLFLPKFDRLGASSRLRSLQYLPFLQAQGYEVTVSPLLSDSMLQEKYRTGRYSFWKLTLAYFARLRAIFSARKFDLVWIEKEALPWVPASVELFLLRRVATALDYDDAVFHVYGLHSSPVVKRVLGRKLESLAKHSSLVIAGNKYLEKWALDAGAPKVRVIPTVVDAQKYYVSDNRPFSSGPIVVWIGSPSTTKYLLDISEALQRLAELFPYRLRVIGATPIVVSGVQIEQCPWTEESEVRLLAECDIGIMPLRDSPWEQGKCAYKLIQYMACGLPTVGSPVGANLDVIVEGVTGLFANDAEGWIDALSVLLRDAELRRRYGRAGRARFESTFALQRTSPLLAELLRTAGER